MNIGITPERRLEMPEKRRLKPNQLRAIHEERVVSEVKNINPNMPGHQKHPWEVEERLVRIAKLIRSNVSLQEIRLKIQKEFGVSKRLACNYIRMVYDELIETYKPEDIESIMAEYVENLKEGMKRSLAAGKYTAFEKLSRLYGEALRLVKPKGFVASDMRIDARKQEIHVGPGNEQLHRLIGMVHGDFIEHLREGTEEPNTERKALPGEHDTLPEIISSGSKEKVRVCD